MTEIRKVNFNLQKWAYKTKNRCTKVKFTEFWYNKTTTKEKKTTVESKKKLEQVFTNATLSIKASVKYFTWITCFDMKLLRAFLPASALHEITGFSFLPLQNESNRLLGANYFTKT